MLNVMDRCGASRTIQCGGCNGNECCLDNVCTREWNTAQLCGNFNLQCGTHTRTDNCNQSRTVDCGGCGADEVCDTSMCCQRASVANFCAGRECGEYTAIECGVSRTEPCGDCPTNYTCNAMTHQCECSESEAELCQQEGFTCGTFDTMDKCGVARTGVACGMCSGGQVCDMNACCDQASVTDFCDGRVCGMFTAPECGIMRTENCGMCSGGGICLSDNSCCQPWSDNELCTEEGAECGPITATDNCGQMRSVSECFGIASGDPCGEGLFCQPDNRCT